MTKIAIAILSYNTRQLTLDTLKSVYEMQIPKGVHIQTLLVDNNSTDGSVKAIQDAYPQVQIIESKQNLGFTGGNNLAAEHAAASNADYLMLLNSDTYAHEDLLNHLLQSFKDHEKAGIVSPKIYFAPGYEFHKDRYSPKDQGRVIWFAGGHMDWDNIIGTNDGVDEVDTGQFDQEKHMNLTTGCCMLIRRELFTDHLLYDDRYFLYYEDADLCQRALQLNYEIWYQPKARLWHVNAGSSASGGNLQDYFITRNRLLFGMTYARPRTKFALTREALKLVLTGRKWQKRAILDYYQNKLGPGSYPIT